MERKGLVEGQTFDTGLRMIGTAGNPCIGSLQERDVAVVMDDLLRYRRKQEIHRIQPQSVPENLVKQHMDLMEVPHAIHVVCARMGTGQDVGRSVEMRGEVQPDTMFDLECQTPRFGILRMLRYVGITELRDGRIGGASLVRPK
jgi:hypothetical protein